MRKSVLMTTSKVMGTLRYCAKIPSPIVLDTDGSSLGKLCGSTLPAPMTSTGNTMTVKFYTDGRDAGRGFNATWRQVTPSNTQGSNNIDRINPTNTTTIRYIYYHYFNYYNRDNLHRR